MSAIAEALRLMEEKWAYVEQIAEEVCPMACDLAVDCRRSSAKPGFLDDTYIKKLETLGQRFADEVKKETLTRVTERIVGGIGEDLFFESGIEYYLTEHD